MELSLHTFFLDTFQNFSSILSQIISSSFLHPYSHGNCNTYSTCMSCVTDTACGWCLGTSTCIARVSWSTCQTSDLQSSYPVTNQSMCSRCTDYHDCMTCTKVSTVISQLEGPRRTPIGVLRASSKHRDRCAEHSSLLRSQ